jgi:hypothetical protein
MSGSSTFSGMYHRSSLQLRSNTSKETAHIPSDFRLGIPNQRTNAEVEPSTHNWNRAIDHHRQDHPHQYTVIHQAKPQPLSSTLILYLAWIPPSFSSTYFALPCLPFKRRSRTLSLKGELRISCASSSSSSSSPSHPCSSLFPTFQKTPALARPKAEVLALLTRRPPFKFLPCLVSPRLALYRAPHDTY